MSTLPVDPVSTINPLAGIAQGLIQGLTGGTSSASGAADSGSPVVFGSINFGDGSAASGGATDSGTFNPRADATTTTPSANIGGNPLGGIFGSALPGGASILPTGRTGGAAAPVNPNPTFAKSSPPLWALGAGATIIGALAYVYLR